MAKELARVGGAGIKAAAKGAKHPAKAAKAAKHVALKHVAKKVAKKAAKKSAKHAGKKAAKHVHLAGGGRDQKRAFHHLQRAASVISLLESESGDELRRLLAQATERYEGGRYGVAAELARAAEHLGMAGLYGARVEFRLEVAEPEETAKLAELRERLRGLKGLDKWLSGMAGELVKAAEIEEDTHLRFELAMAAEGICVALEHSVVL
jgi:hypothetical protein